MTRMDNVRLTHRLDKKGEVILWRKKMDVQRQALMNRYSEREDRRDRKFQVLVGKFCKGRERKTKRQRVIETERVREG
jgi:hypothetical protein